MILVFGADGLLGSTICRLYPKDTLGATRANCDITYAYGLRKFIDKISPDVIINCAGIVKSRSVSIVDRYNANAYAPMIMRDFCDNKNIRLIQVSTDCIFDGKQGKYDENNLPCPTDHYGYSKWKGEITTEPHLTVRSSFIGWPDYKGRGLIAWMMSHKGGEVHGYTKSLWNGLTIVEMSSYIVEVAYSAKVVGLRHVFGETVSKFDVLQAINEVYELGCTIIPSDQPVKNMTLSTLYNDMPMIEGMGGTLYDRVRLMKETLNGNSY
jgi:dTDP-4-dehydrorhamnose reductase